MSVSVNGLTKIYGEQKAIDNVSFEAAKGEVVGFLGPNGAGKTTTMKIVTCFIPPSSGTVTVSGYNIADHSIEVRKRIGYLPEHNPLYKDMYVREYLSFMAGLHKVAGISKRVKEVIDMVGLGLEQHKFIGQLSKGYRQRVGLAQAIIHDPEVLILDEPTSGLDPNQLVEIRRLIKDLGKEKTVIFSTHIMQEVQAICDRVLIINRGKIVADTPIGKLQDQFAGKTIITVEFSGPMKKEDLEKIPDVAELVHAGGNRWQLTSGVDKDIRQAIHAFSVEKKIAILEMHKEIRSVEEVFQELTKQ
jgi:ABC-2 type transport system ATP-binding protein